MRRLALLALLPVLLCGFTGLVGGNPNPLTFWWYAGDPTVLRPALECALARIRAASCLPVDVSFDAHHWVRQKTPAEMGGAYGSTYGTWVSTRIAVSTAASNPCNTLIHEIGQHVLRVSNSHVEPQTGILHEDLLTAICSVRACGCFNPEPIP